RTALIWAAIRPGCRGASSGPKRSTDGPTEPAPGRAGRVEVVEAVPGLAEYVKARLTPTGTRTNQARTSSYAFCPERPESPHRRSRPADPTGHGSQSGRAVRHNP